MTQKVVTTKGSKKAATIINESKRVYFFGVGGSEIVATDAYHKFCVPLSQLLTARITIFN